MDDAQVELSDGIFEVLSSDVPSEQLQQMIHEQGWIGEIKPALYSLVPGFNKVMGAINSFRNIQDRFLANKILRFFAPIEELDVGERLEFLSQFESDKDYKNRVVEHLIVLLDQCDHIDKAELIGRLYTGLVKGRISEEQYWRLATSVRKAYIEDLRQLLEHFSRTASSDPATWERLHASGLSSVNLGFIERRGKSFMVAPRTNATVYGPNSEAQLLAKVVLESISQT